MNMIKITCTKCNAVGSMSLIDPNFNGPFKCWKCRAYYTLVIHNNKVESLVPLSEEEMKRQEEVEALKAKFRRGGGGGGGG